MDTEVYLLCKTCNGITDGTGSGDNEDSITCASCGRKLIRATGIGKFKPFGLKEKRLYVEKDQFSVLIKEDR